MRKGWLTSLHEVGDTHLTSWAESPDGEAVMVLRIHLAGQLTQYLHYLEDHHCLVSPTR
jgi:hypothetical protein